MDNARTVNPPRRTRGDQTKYPKKEVLKFSPEKYTGVCQVDVSRGEEQKGHSNHDKER